MDQKDHLSEPRGATQGAPSAETAESRRGQEPAHQLSRMEMLIHWKNNREEQRALAIAKRSVAFPPWKPSFANSRNPSGLSGDGSANQHAQRNTIGRRQADRPTSPTGPPVRRNSSVTSTSRRTSSDAAPTQDNALYSHRHQPQQQKCVWNDRRHSMEHNSIGPKEPRATSRNRREYPPQPGGAIDRPPVGCLSTGAHISLGPVTAAGGAAARPRSSWSASANVLSDEHRRQTHSNYGSRRPSVASDTPAVLPSFRSSTSCTTSDVAGASRRGRSRSFSRPTRSSAERRQSVDRSPSTNDTETTSNCAGGVRNFAGGVTRSRRASRSTEPSVPQRPRTTSEANHPRLQTGRGLQRAARQPSREKPGSPPTAPPPPRAPRTGPKVLDDVEVIVIDDVSRPNEISGTGHHRQNSVEEETVAQQPLSVDRRGPPAAAATHLRGGLEIGHHIDLDDVHNLKGSAEGELGSQYAICSPHTRPKAQLTGGFSHRIEKKAVDVQDDFCPTSAGVKVGTESLGSAPVGFASNPEPSVAACQDRALRCLEAFNEKLERMEMAITEAVNRMMLVQQEQLSRKVVTVAAGCQCSIEFLHQEAQTEAVPSFATSNLESFPLYKDGLPVSRVLHTQQSALGAPAGLVIATPPGGLGSDFHGICSALRSNSILNPRCSMISDSLAFSDDGRDIAHLEDLANFNSSMYHPHNSESCWGGLSGYPPNRTPLQARSSIRVPVTNMDLLNSGGQSIFGMDSVFRGTQAVGLSPFSAIRLCPNTAQPNRSKHRQSLESDTAACVDGRPRLTPVTVEKASKKTPGQQSDNPRPSTPATEVADENHRHNVNQNVSTEQKILKQVNLTTNNFVCLNEASAPDPTSEETSEMTKKDVRPRSGDPQSLHEEDGADTGAFNAKMTVWKQRERQTSFERAQSSSANASKMTLHGVEPATDCRRSRPQSREFVPHMSSNCAGNTVASSRSTPVGGTQLSGPSLAGMLLNSSTTALPDDSPILLPCQAQMVVVGQNLEGEDSLKLHRTEVGPPSGQLAGMANSNYSFCSADEHSSTSPQWQDGNWKPSSSNRDSGEFHQNVSAPKSAAAVATRDFRNEKSQRYQTSVVNVDLGQSITYSDSGAGATSQRYNYPTFEDATAGAAEFGSGENNPINNSNSLASELLATSSGAKLDSCYKVNPMLNNFPTTSKTVPRESLESSELTPRPTLRNESANWIV